MHELVNKSYKVILATAMNELNHELMSKAILQQEEGEIKFKEICNYFNEIPAALRKVAEEIQKEQYTLQGTEELTPVLVLSYAIGGLAKQPFENITFEIINWINEFSGLKVIFLLGQTNITSNLSFLLDSLARQGVILFTKQQISYLNILNDIFNDKSYEEIIKDAGLKRTETKIVSNLQIESAQENVKTSHVDGKKNVIAISSIKPGTGKSFTSTNTAIALAKYGINPNTDKPFRVCIVDVDLQTLSVGTVLNISDQGKNLKKCVLLVDEFLKGERTGIKESELKDKILQCMVQYDEVPSLSILCGSQLDLAEVETMPQEAFVYIIEFLSEQFDYVVIDTNSSLHHTTTQPILEMAGKIYYITNLDFNNIYNNVRYQEDLNEFGFAHKIKYVLNQDTPDLYVGPEPKCSAAFIQSKTDMKIDFKIQDLTSTVFNNLCFDGIPLVLTDDAFTLQQRVEFLKIVEDICGNVPQLRKMKESYAFYLNSYAKKRGKDVHITPVSQEMQESKEQPVPQQKKGLFQIFSKNKGVV